MNNSIVLLIIMYGIILWFLYPRIAPVKGLKTLSSEDFQSNIEGSDKVLLDVRQPSEYHEGYIPGALNIPLTQLKQRIADIPQDKEIYLYCRSGMRSKQAARILSKKGFSNLSHLHRGISHWSGKLKK